jgi:hypothetical protein
MGQFAEVFKAIDTWIGDETPLEEREVAIKIEREEGPATS